MTCPTGSAADTAVELDFGALYFRCRGVLNLGALCFRCSRVLSKAQLAGFQNPDPLVQTGLRIIQAEQTSWDKISIILQHSEDVLCNKEDRILDRISNLFRHQPGVRPLFDDALHYDKAIWRKLTWTQISEYFNASRNTDVPVRCRGRYGGWRAV